MTIEPFKESHIEDAARMALDAYLAEQSSVQILPPDNGGFLDVFSQELKGLTGASDPAGFAATERGRLVGLLAGYPVEHFFSSHGGVYVPLAGHCATGPEKRLVAQKLYEAASGAWVREGRLTHCISMFAHDAETVDTWYWLGFGLRCVDAMRTLAPVAGAAASALEVRKAEPKDAETLFPLHAEHCRYYGMPPLFMPSVSMEDSPEDFRQWLSEKDHHLWAAWRGGEPVSYMRIRHGGETFVSDDPKTMNICAAYTKAEARGTGAGGMLLSAIVDWMREQGYERLGTDYESFNIYGSRFWMKHFTPFMFSAVRCIDDRIPGSNL